MFGDAVPCDAFELVIRVRFDASVASPRRVDPCGLRFLALSGVRRARACQFVFLCRDEVSTLLVGYCSLRNPSLSENDSRTAGGGWELVEF